MTANNKLCAPHNSAEAFCTRAACDALWQVHFQGGAATPAEVEYLRGKGAVQEDTDRAVIDNWTFDEVWGAWLTRPSVRGELDDAGVKYELAETQGAAEEGPATDTDTETPRSTDKTVVA